MLVTVALVVVSSLGGAVSARKSGSSVLPEVWNEIAVEYLGRSGSNPSCKTCPKIKQILERRNPELNLTNMRVEMVKQDILRKLGLDAPPSSSFRYSALPLPIAEGTLFNQHKEKIPPKKPTIERLVAFASDIKCSKDSTGMNLKLKFILPEQVKESDQLVSGKLWLYLSQPWLGKGSGILSVKPCGSQDPATIKSVPITLQTIDMKGGWVEKEVTWMLQDKEECYSFKIAWTADASGDIDCSAYLDSTKKPFLLLDVVAENASDVLRDKRSVNCAKGVTDCCREKLYISFKDIGWADWIYQPGGYDAYYCKGNCGNLGALSLGGTPYQSVIKKLMMKNSHMLDLTQCCTPTTLSAVQLIYMGNNDTVVQKTIPNLTVESCGCM